MRSAFLLLPLLHLAAEAPAQFFVRDAGPQPPMPVDQAVHDTVRGRTVVLTDTGTWEHDGFTWSSVATAQLPPARYEHAMVFDGQRVLLYGGQDGNGPGALGDFWSYDGVQWTPIAMGASNPGLRRAHAMAFDAARNRVVLYGGTDMQGAFPTDTWEWDGTAWTQLAMPNPGSRVWHRMVFDPLRNRIVLCLGANNPVLYRDTWEYDGASWVQTNPNQLPPRLNAGLVFDLLLQRVVLIGGQDPLFLGDDVFVYDGAAATWTVLPAVGNPGTWLQTAAAFDLAAGRTLLVGREDLFTNPDVQTRFLYSSGSLTASYTPFGQGCPRTLNSGPRPGTAPASVLAAVDGSLPLRSTAFGVEVQGIGGASVVLLAAGVSTANWNGAPLPLDLGFAGMAGCPLLIAPVAFGAMAPTGNDSARYTLRIPASSALAGVTFHQQALVLDPTNANGVGSTSNACTAVVQ